MASYAYTFTSGDTVTPTKLNNARTVSSIVNADISNSAAIAGTKVSPDFGSQNIQTTGVGLFTRPSNHWVTSGYFGVGPSSGRIGQLDTHGAFELTLTSNGYRDNTAGTNLWVSHGANGETGAAQIGLNPTGDIRFKTETSKPTGSASVVTERMRITGDGNVGIANTSPSEKLHVTGNIKASGYIDADTSFRGQSSDSASAPSYTWNGNTNTGMFRPATDTIAFSTVGSERMRIASDGKFGIGTTSPAYLLDVAGNINTNAGYRVNNQLVVQGRKTGWGVPTGTASRTSFNPNNIGVEALAQRVKALIDDLTDHGLIGA